MKSSILSIHFYFFREKQKSHFFVEQRMNSDLDMLLEVHIYGTNQLRYLIGSWKCKSGVQERDPD